LKERSITMKISILKVAIVVFILATAISTVGLAYAYMSPTESVETTIKAAYKHTGTFDYVAHIAPNLIYNRTEVGSDVQKIYTNLLERMDLYFAYSFVTNASVSSLNAELSLKLAVESPNRWSRELTIAEAAALVNLSIEDSRFHLYVNKSSLDAFVKLLDLETGTSTTEYNLRIRPTITTSAVTSAGNVEEKFVSETNISFKQDVGGRYLTVSPLSTTKDGKLVETKRITYEYVNNQRILFTIALLASLAGLGFMGWTYFRKRPPKTSSEIVEKILSENKDLIVNAEIEKEETAKYVEVKDFEELKKLAEILARPILHTLTDKEQLFLVIDNGTRYTYKIPQA